MKRTSVALSFCFAVVLLSATPTYATTLSGSTLFSTTGGNFNGASWWDTVGGNIAWNLYYQDNGTATWLNVGNGAGTALNLTLNPGTYVLDYFAQAVPLTTAGLNLYFNGSTTAQISASTTANTAGFAANSGITYQLSGSNSAGAGTLTYDDGTNTIVLSNLVLFNPSATQVPAVDLVQAYNNAPNGSNDNHGQLTLTVRADAPGPGVPEPATVALLGAGLAALGFRSRRRAA